MLRIEIQCFSKLWINWIEYINAAYILPTSGQKFKYLKACAIFRMVWLCSPFWIIARRFASAVYITWFKTLFFDFGTVMQYLFIRNIIRNICSTKFKLAQFPEYDRDIHVLQSIWAQVSTFCTSITDHHGIILLKSLRCEESFCKKMLKLNDINLTSFYLMRGLNMYIWIQNSQYCKKRVNNYIEL